MSGGTCEPRMIIDVSKSGRTDHGGGDDAPRHVARDPEAKWYAGAGKSKRSYSLAIADEPGSCTACVPELPAILVTGRSLDELRHAGSHSPLRLHATRFGCMLQRRFSLLIRPYSCMWLICGQSTPHPPHVARAAARAARNSDPLFRKPLIKSIYQDVRIKESGRGREDPLLSSPCAPTAVYADPAPVALGCPIEEQDTSCGIGQTVSSLEWGLPESHLLPESTRSHRRGECCSDRRSFSALLRITAAPQEVCGVHTGARSRGVVDAITRTVAVEGSGKRTLPQSEVLDHHQIAVRLGLAIEEPAAIGRYAQRQVDKGPFRHHNWPALPSGEADELK
jgi:hypothetical protein